MQNVGVGRGGQVAESRLQGDVGQGDQFPARWSSDSALQCYISPHCRVFHEETFEGN